MYSTHPPHDQSVQRTLPHPEPRPNPPQETTSNLPHPPLLPEVSHSTIPSQNSSIHNTNNSSGTLNRVTGDQRFDARSVSTLLNCEGTTIQLVVMSGEAAGEAAGEARATGQVLRDGDGGASSRAEIQRLQARTEELQSDIEWMETRAEDLLLEIERLKDDLPPLEEWGGIEQSEQGGLVGGID
ncbi:hypothetical protein PC9H_011005 [Pleurotus ostreatus]|uniref:Uncharacterized protein n=1 Tax=Pleurotus ostreatus TaxID=5322 RepID=A0A8H7DMI1_PLEOS|nr:uncharacterized protein PC9H_011005 [Pleurotus ostreatus]KAF7422846.1 hypothetical protein PC9H_011005 [Pleurotus ostreatus]